MCTCFARLYNAFILFWQLVLVAKFVSRPAWRWAGGAQVVLKALSSKTAVDTSCQSETQQEKCGSGQQNNDLKYARIELRVSRHVITY